MKPFIIPKTHRKKWGIQSYLIEENRIIVWYPFTTFLFTTELTGDESMEDIKSMMERQDSVSFTDYVNGMSSSRYQSFGI